MRNYPQDVPVYRVLSERGFFGPDDKLYPEGAEIILHDEPNEEMEPLNDVARKAYRVHIEKLDDCYRLMCEKNGRSYIARPKHAEDMIAENTENARRVQLVKDGPGVPLMAGKKRGRPRIVRVDTVETPETGRVGKLSLHNA